LNFFYSKISPKLNTIRIRKKKMGGGESGDLEVAFAKFEFGSKIGLG
jgi:hypothetical protein